LFLLFGCGKDNTVVPAGTSEIKKTDETSLYNGTSEIPTETKETALTALQQFLKGISGYYDAQQIILSYQETETEKSNGKVCVFEKTADGTFAMVLSDIEVVYGREGLDKNAEGDGRSPSGVYHIPYAFGASDISGELMIRYRTADDTDYWIDDTDSTDYNTWQSYEGDPDEKWASYERLNISSYRIAFVIDYNRDRVKNKGSAIFFHVWKNDSTYTSGCTAADERDVLRILKILDASKNPVIAQGSIEFFKTKYGIDIGKEIRDGSF
jgi:L,D-peptidoglycan transpeptidase YkuD (ErfK/YbiS/YcfS/YnhG family)